MNALHVAKESKQAGDEVAFVFSSGGLSTVELAYPEHRLHRAYEQVENKLTGICRFCARA